MPPSAKSRKDNDPEDGGDLTTPVDPPATSPDPEDPDGGEERASAGEGLTELLGFMLADEEYALDILEIKEIIRLQTITAVPRTPDYLKGIITLRGVIVPVFDLRRRLGLDAAGHGQHTRIVVVYRGDEFAGMIVDSITQVMRVGVKEIEPPPPTIGAVEAEFIKGVTRHQERLIILLNLARVLEVKS
jgi:purine-binding chemotaxis protein CheW